MSARLAVDFNDLKTGFQSGRAARLSDWAFRKEQREFSRLVGILRARKWDRENPERKRELKRRWSARPDVKPKLVEHVKRWRHARARLRVEVCACPGCDVQWCRVPFGRLRGNVRPRFCSKLCRNRARWDRRKQRLTARSASAGQEAASSPREGMEPKSDPVIATPTPHGGTET